MSFCGLIMSFLSPSTLSLTLSLTQAYQNISVDANKAAIVITKAFPDVWVWTCPFRSGKDNRWFSSDELPRTFVTDIQAGPWRWGVDVKTWGIKESDNDSFSIIINDVLYCI